MHTLRMQYPLYQNPNKNATSTISKPFPMELYTVKRPPETSVADSYYIIEFGETDIFIEITYLDGQIHLVPKSELSSPLTEENKPLIAWYYYALGLALANTIPFGWFTKSKKVSKKHKK